MAGTGMGILWVDCWPGFLPVHPTQLPGGGALVGWVYSAGTGESQGLARAEFQGSLLGGAQEDSSQGQLMVELSLCQHSIWTLVLFSAAPPAVQLPA